MKFKLSFRLIVTIASILLAILFGLIRVSDPEITQVLRLKYFDVLQKKYPRSTEGQTYSVIVDIDEKSLRSFFLLLPWDVAKIIWRSFNSDAFSGKGMIELIDWWFFNGSILKSDFPLEVVLPSGIFHALIL